MPTPLSKPHTPSMEEEMRKTFGKTLGLIGLVVLLGTSHAADLPPNTTKQVLTVTGQFYACNTGALKTKLSATAQQSYSDAVTRCETTYTLRLGTAATKATQQTGDPQAGQAVLNLGNGVVRAEKAALEHAGEVTNAGEQY